MNEIVLPIVNKFIKKIIFKFLFLTSSTGFPNHYLNASKVIEKNFIIKSGVLNGWLYLALFYLFCLILVITDL